MVQTWGGVKLIKKSWIFLVDHFKYNHVGKGRLWNGPADTRRNNNAIITSKRRRDVVLT